MRPYVDVPDGWNRRRLRFDVKTNPVKSELDLPPDAEVSFVPMEAIGQLGQLELTRTRPLEKVYNGYTYFADGDVCIAKITPCFENGKGALAGNLTNGVAFGTTELHVLRPLGGLDARFLFYLTVAHDFRSRGEAEMIGAGGQKRVPEDFLKNWLPLLPPVGVQRGIVQFLDEKTARIDALIAKKRTLLDRLAERRQALITRAVTQGLDPDAPRKRSGIDWLGEIPAHWEVKRLKFIAAEPLSYGANEAAEFDEPTWPRFVRITDVDELGRLRDETFRSLPPDVAERFLLRENDLLLARSGATVGKSFIYDPSWGEACHAGYLIKVRVRKDSSARFVYWFMNSGAYWGWVGSSFIQSTIQNINAERYSNLTIALPPTLNEQERIADFIEDGCKRLDEQADAVERSVSKLEEYRGALVTAAVTGQIEGLR